MHVNNACYGYIFECLGRQHQRVQLQQPLGGNMRVIGQSRVPFHALLSSTRRSQPQKNRLSTNFVWTDQEDAPGRIKWCLALGSAAHIDMCFRGKDALRLQQYPRRILTLTIAVVFEVSHRCHSHRKIVLNVHCETVGWHTKNGSIRDQILNACATTLVTRPYQLTTPLEV